MSKRNTIWEICTQKVPVKLDPSLGREVEVKTACGADLEVAFEVFFLHCVATRVALPEEPFTERFLLGGIDPRFGLDELRHGVWLA